MVKASITFEGFSKIDKKLFLAISGIKIATISKSNMGKSKCPNHSCLWVRTGRLRASIRPLKMTNKKVEVGTYVWYGLIHEYGLRKTWIVKPKRAKALKIPLSSGEVIFRKKAVIRGIPARPFLRPALKQFIEKELDKTIDEVLKL